MIADVYADRQKALVFFGPLRHQVRPRRPSGSLPSMVKAWRPERPGSTLGLLECLRKKRTGGVLQLDDIDGFWDNAESIGILKPALESSDQRFISHTVGGSCTRGMSVPRFELHCGIIFLSNRDFNDPKQFRQDISAIKDRSILCGLSFDPMDLYEYTCWLCTEGGMLKRTYISENRRAHFLTLKEANEVLEHFRVFAPRYPQITPRTLAKFARMRIGVSHSIWQDKAWRTDARQADLGLARSTRVYRGTGCPEGSDAEGGGRAIGFARCGFAAFTQTSAGSSQEARSLWTADATKTSWSSAEDQTRSVGAQRASPDPKPVPECRQARYQTLAEQRANQDFRSSLHIRSHRTISLK